MNILLTNDDGYKSPGIWALANRLKKKHNIYIVAPDGERSGASHSASFFAALSYVYHGNVDGVKYGHSKVKLTGIEEGNARLEVIIFEGKNREIRKMFEAVEKKVIFLKRVAIGDLRLGGLSRGGYRELSEIEVAYLKQLCEKAGANKQ